MERASGNRLLETIYNELIEISNDCELDSEGAVYDAIRVASKLVSNDYFKSSEAYVDANKSASIDGMPTMLCSGDMLNKWYKLYTLDLKEKQADMERLFEIIVAHAEEWI